MVVGITVVSNLMNLKTDNPIRQEWTLFGPKEEIRYPTDRDRQKMQETYRTILNNAQEMEELKSEIQAIHERILLVNVSSKAHRDYKLIKEKISEYDAKLDGVIGKITKFEEDYSVFLNLDDKIPKYLVEFREKYASFIEEMTDIQEKMNAEKQKCIDTKQELEEILSTSWEKADSLFWRDFPIMKIICYYEQGTRPDKEIAFECNMIENRIESNRGNFANQHTAEEVVWAEGQFSPTWKSPMNQTSPRVEKVVESYLRGEFETNMPEGVLFQAGFVQGRIWYHVPGSDYFCFG